MGVDENGLGARLGPLVVTAVLARAQPGAVDQVLGLLQDELGRDLGDSKELVSHRNYELGEAWARALGGPRVQRPSELLARLSLDDPRALARLCPPKVAGQCWSPQSEGFSARPETLVRVRQHLQRLQTAGVRVLTVRVVLVCTQQLNQARGSGQSRFVVDLHQMERLMLALRDHAGVELETVCGKVGAIRDYPSFFGPLAGRLYTVLEQEKDVSSYRIAGVGKIRFLRDADASDPLVMIASLVGKYLRELVMARIARYYAWKGDRGELPSGYHDPVTERFVRATLTRRREQGVPDACFERRGRER